MTKAAIITCPGFRQTAGTRFGLSKLHRRLVQAFPNREAVYPLALRAWNEDMYSLAEQVNDYDPEFTAFIPYSYGAGWALVKFSEVLQDFGRGVDIAYLIDPVPRYRFLPAKLISLTRKGSYEVPRNVIDVKYWRQVNATPYGRAPSHPEHRTECIAVYGTEKNKKHALERELHHWEYSDDTHNHIDDREDIHDYIINDLLGRIVA